MLQLILTQHIQVSRLSIWEFGSDMLWNAMVHPHVSPCQECCIVRKICIPISYCIIFQHRDLSSLGTGAFESSSIGWKRQSFGKNGDSICNICGELSHGQKGHQTCLMVFILRKQTKPYLGWWSQFTSTHHYHFEEWNQLDRSLSIRYFDDVWCDGIP